MPGYRSRAHLSLYPDSEVALYAVVRELPEDVVAQGTIMISLGLADVLIISNTILLSMSASCSLSPGLEPSGSQPADVHDPCCGSTGS